MSAPSRITPLDSGMKRSSVGKSLRSLARMGKGFSLRGTSYAAGRFLKTELWVWPVIAAVTLSVIAWWVNGAVERTMQRQVTATIETIRNADTTGARIWLKEQEANAKILAMSERVAPLVKELLEIKGKSKEPEMELIHARQMAELRDYLAPRIAVFGYEAFFVVADARTVASTLNETIGRQVRSEPLGVFREGADARASRHHAVPQQPQAPR